MFPKFKSILSFLLFVFVLSASLGTVQAAGNHAEWTIMVYMSGDNELEPYVVSDIQTELAPIGSTAEVQIVALADRAPRYDTSAGDWTGTLLFHVTQGMTAEPGNAVADWGEKNMGDPKTLIDFVSWTRSNYPADHYALYFWGHGQNWHPDFTMEDKTDQDTLDPDEMAASMPALGFIDMVGYDGCNMAAIEIQGLWRNNARAISHSEEWVGSEGIEYDKVIAALKANPTMSADELAVRTTQSTQFHEKTWSAVVLDKRWDRLQQAVDEWAAALTQALPSQRKSMDQAFGAARSFWQDPATVDLYDAAFQVKALVKDPAVRAKSQAVMNAVNDVVLSEWHIKQYKAVRGITIHLPTRVQYLDLPDTPQNDFDYYRDLSFAANTRWDEFLAAYLGVP
ncbi:MAG TPA: clostripain-related cysteine peptidase [Anaerolineales bacterium]|nr:clostripain-related cysteine peptidase [Anaerolineales bacterium]